jgi:3-oxoacyl-[acyl-carrier-protein] synthase III
MIKIKKIYTILSKKKEANSIIEKEFSLKKNSIKRLTGIKRRYISGVNETSEGNAVKVCKKIPKNYVKNISHIIGVTNTPSIKFPGISNYVSSELKLENVHCLNLNLGCTGYVDAISLAYDIINSYKKNKVLIVTSDTYSKFISKNNKSIRPLFSDGASATIIEHSKIGFKIQSRRFKNVPNSQNDLIFKDYITMNGPAVVSFAIKNVIPVLRENQKKTKVIYLHQAGKIIVDLIKKNFDKKIFVPENFSKYGNLVSGSLPFLIKEYFKSFNRSKKIIICGFGVGLSYSTLILKKNSI